MATCFSVQHFELKAFQLASKHIELQHLPLSSPGDHNPRSAILINLLLDLRAEANSTHDTISKLLIQDRLVRISVVLDDFVQSVDHRFDGWHGTGAPTVGEAHELRCEDLLLQAENLRQLLDVFRRGRRLTIENGGDGDLATAEVLGDLFKGEVRLGLRGEQLQRLLANSSLACDQMSSNGSV